MKSKFQLGQTMQTRRIAAACENNETFTKEIYSAFFRYVNCDWGNTSAEDRALNDSAVEKNNDRIVAKYITSKGVIFIITEHDRSATTILFADEY